MRLRVKTTETHQNKGIGRWVSMKRAKKPRFAAQIEAIVKRFGVNDVKERREAGFGRQEMVRVSWVKSKSLMRRRVRSGRVNWV